jgi:DNA-binding response OmpR family regulator
MNAMKVLAADSNNRFRQGLVEELKTLGYDVEEVDTGAAALLKLSSDTPPPAALLAWDLEGLSGVALCTELRKKFANDASKIQPYIIIICEANNPELLLQAADAGADDFLPEKWHKNDLNVRMRLAVRTIDLQRALQTHIKELETVLRRHDLLREVVSKMSPKEREAAAHETTPPTSEHNSKLNFSDKISKIPAFGNLHTTIANVFSQLGCGRATATIPQGLTLAQDLVHLVWTPMYLSDHDAWIDIKVEMNNHSAQKLYLEMLGQEPQSKEDLFDALGEMLNIVQGALKSTFAKENVPSRTITLPIVLSAFGVGLPKTVSGNFEKCEVTIGDIKALFTVIVSDAPQKDKPAEEVLEYDIMYKPFFSPRNPHLPVLPEGTIVTDFLVKKLQSFANPKNPVLARVVEPSRIARRAMAARRE